MIHLTTHLKSISRNLQKIQIQKIQKSDPYRKLLSHTFYGMMMVGLLSFLVVPSLSQAQVNIQVTSKSAQLMYGGPGSEYVLYTINILNNSINIATGVVVSDFLMSGLNYQSSTISISGATNSIIPAQAFSSTGRQLYRSVGSMLPSQSAVITYSGALSSPEVSSGLMLWLDSQYITGLSNNQPLNTWFDRSAFGNHFGLSVIGFSPTYFSSLIDNNRPYVRFLAPQGLSRGGLTTGSGTINAMSVFLVSNNIDTGDNIILSTQDPNGQHFRFSSISSGGSALATFDRGSWISGGKLTGAYAGSTTATSLWTLTAAMGASGSMSISKDGSTIAQKQGGSLAITGLSSAGLTWSIGHNHGDISLVMMYNRVLNASELTLMHNYIARRQLLFPSLQQSTGYFSPFGATSTGQLYTAPVPVGPVNVDLSVSHTGSVATAVSNSQVSFVITYNNATSPNYIATGVVLDYTVGSLFTYQTGSLIPSLVSGSLIRYNLPNLGTGATGQIIITGTIFGLSGQTVQNTVSISSSTPDTNISNNTRSASIVIFNNGLPYDRTGYYYTGYNYTGASPLIVLRDLVNKYNQIISRANPPTLMSDIVGSPYLSHIATMINNGIMIGYSKDGKSRFAPNKHLVRGEFAIIIGRILSLSQNYVNNDISTRFVDIEQGSTYVKFINQIDALGRADIMGIGIGSSGLKYFNPHRKVTQNEVRAVLAELLRLKGYNPASLDRFPSGNGSVTRGEIAYLLTEIIRNDPNITLGYNHRLLDVLKRRLESFGGDIARERMITYRVMDKVSTTDPDRLQGLGLYAKGLIRDLQDALSGSITPKINGKNSVVYSNYGGSLDPFEALLNERAQ